MEKYNIENATVAQEQYQIENGVLAFAPATGKCWSCRRNIYKPYYWKKGEFKKTITTYWESYSYEKIESSSEDFDMVTGITVKEARGKLITSCPHCNKSYCD